MYTAAQAGEGERVAQQQCSFCHNVGVEWPTVLQAYAGRPLLELYDLIRNTMPQHAPGSLSRQEYADVVAYMLSVVDAPTGASTLPSSDEGLGEILITRRN